MLIDIEKFSRSYFLPALLLFCPVITCAAPATRNDCRPFQQTVPQPGKPLTYSNAVFWKVSARGQAPSYILGTIHVSDPRITRLPAPVQEALGSARVFVMETLPDQEENMKLSAMMYFQDGKRLRDYLDDEMYKLTAGILGAYKVTPDYIARIKPWAAGIIMSYPRDEGLPLDLQLLEMARSKGAETRGLETLSEQGHIFSSLDMKSQVRLLLDTVCNYDIINNDFETMKKLYLKSDLQGLYDHSMQNTFPGDRLYEYLYGRLLTDRNRIMAARLSPALAKGNAFIAIGALHLPGEDGILSLLAKQGYRLTAIH